jgi:hypothetical protein
MAILVLSSAGMVSAGQARGKGRRARPSFPSATPIGRSRKARPEADADHGRYEKPQAEDDHGGHTPAPANQRRKQNAEKMRSRALGELPSEAGWSRRQGASGTTSYSPVLRRVSGMLHRCSIGGWTTTNLFMVRLCSLSDEITRSPGARNVNRKVFRHTAKTCSASSGGAGGPDTVSGNSRQSSRR